MEKHHQHKSGHYGRFGVELILEFIVMYLAMYSMIATLDHFRFNLNTVYMALIMLAPMTLVMLVSMRSMFPSPRTNLLFAGGAVIAFLIGFGGMRTQGAVGDKELLRAMIPHHSIAILTSERARIKDPRVRKLADKIIDSQRREIEQMKALVDELQAQ